MNRASPVRVLFLSHSAGLNGAVRCLHLLLAGLDRGRFAPVVLLPETGEFERLLRQSGIEVIVSPIPWWVGNGGNDWPTFQRFGDGLEERVAALAEIIREQRIDLVVTNSAVIADGALAAQRAGVPHVWHIMEMVSRDPVLAPMLSTARFYECMALLSERIIVVSDAVRREIVDHWPTNKVVVTYTGLPAEEAAATMGGPPRGTLPCEGLPGPRIVFVGDLSERKGVTDLLAAAPAVLKQHREARFLIVGDDQGRRAAAAALIQKHALAESVFLLGRRRDVFAILAAADVFVLPTLADPLPLVVLEAMRAGLPVVATRSGGCEEMVVDGETGYLVDVHDVSALGERIARLLDQPDVRRRMGDNGCCRFHEHFGYERHIMEFASVLDRVLAAGRCAPAASESLALRCVEDLLGELAKNKALLGARIAALEAATAAMKRSRFWRVRNVLAAVWRGGREALRGAKLRGGR